MRKKLALFASFAAAGALSFQFGLTCAYAASHKIDCAQVMTELQAGKKVGEVATDMKISKSSVYRCRKKAKQESAAAMGSMNKGGAMASPEAMASPAAMGSPAAAPAAH
jgi:hypothetical protein